MIPSPFFMTAASQVRLWGIHLDLGKSRSYHSVLEALNDLLCIVIVSYPTEAILMMVTRVVHSIARIMKVMSRYRRVNFREGEYSSRKIDDMRASSR